MDHQQKCLIRMLRVSGGSDFELLFVPVKETLREFVWLIGSDAKG